MLHDYSNPTEEQARKDFEEELHGMEDYLVEIGRCTGRQLQCMTWKEIKDAYYQETEG
jgi:hypothetical protein